MKHMAYCLKFNLFATHYMNNNEENTHAHTWRISTFISSDTDFEYFYKLEKMLSKVFEKYENSVLNKAPEFQGLTPDLETIGEVFFEEVSGVLREYDMKLDRLEISEVPARVYVVRNVVGKKKKKKSTVEKMSTRNFLKGIVNYSVNISTGRFTEEKPPLPVEVLESTVAEEDEIVSVSHEVLPQKEYKHVFLKSMASMVSMLIFGVFILMWLNRFGRHPWGSDIYGHIFKGDLLYKALLDGEFYPLFTNLWYNGIQPFRYWAPLPYYVMALTQFIAGGDVLAGYNVFIYLGFIVGGIGWLMWGIAEKRIFLATVLGILWFCFPDNLRVFFSEGNIPRVVITFILPYLFFFIWQYMQHNKKRYLLATVLTMTFICLCHLMVAAMIGITVFIYLFIYSIQNGGFGNPFIMLYNFIRGKPVESKSSPIIVLVAMVFGIVISGFWMYPAMHGGFMMMDPDAVATVMVSLTYNFTESLNPVMRLTTKELFYFGLSFVSVSVVGVFMAGKKSAPGFITVLIVFLGTTPSFLPIISKLPLNQLFWMLRFTPIVYAIACLSMIIWKTAKRKVIFLIMVLFIADSLVSFNQLVYNNGHYSKSIDMFEECAENTTQRMSNMDLSTMGSWPSFYVCAGENPVPYAYGWAWQGATTSPNIVLLNTALENEYYDFMFDRNLELGCDSIMIKKTEVKHYDKLIKSAAKSGYYLLKEYDSVYFFKKDTPKNFGLISKYYGLAIGASASTVTLQFPGYQIGNSNYLDDYTLEELLQYEMVFVSGFEYHLRYQAEKLLYDAAERGVKIIVDMNRVPTDVITNRMTFMAVTAQPIQFENKLPDLHIAGVPYFPTTFKKEYRNWNTVYLENVPHPTGFAWMAGNKLVFIGDDYNRNITYIGLNLLFHGMVNEDQMAIDIYAGVMGRNAETLPQRELVPLNIKYEDNHITIRTNNTGVNTTLANQDAFITDQDNYLVHNLFHVSEKQTEIDIECPHVGTGVIMSLVGVFATALLFIFLSIVEKTAKKEAAR